MSDTDEMRAALSDALRLPGEVQARPAAAGTIRARARSRRRATVVILATAVPACVVVALLVGTGGGDQRSTTTPATTPTATPSSTPTPAQITVAPGPRRLATPIELHPVLRAYGSCPADKQTVPAFDGPGCYRLGPSALVVRRVQNLELVPLDGANGPVAGGVNLDLTMNARDAVAFSSLTAQLLHKQVALVIDGRVQVAPTIESRITEGIVQIGFAPGSAQAVLVKLIG